MANKGNPNWVKGGPSPFPSGRTPRKSSPTIKKQLERFVKRNLSPRRLQALFDGLEARDKLTFLVDVLPYVESKKAIVQDINVNQLNDVQVSALFNEVLTAIAPEPGESKLITMPDYEQAQIVNP